MKNSLCIFSFIVFTLLLQPLVATANPADKFQGAMLRKCSDENFLNEFSIDNKKCQSGMQTVIANCTSSFAKLLDDKSAENKETLIGCVAANASMEFGNGREELINGRGPSSGFVPFNEYKADMIDPACSRAMLKKCTTVTDNKCSIIVEAVADSCTNEYIDSIIKPSDENDKKHASCMIKGFSLKLNTDADKLEKCLRGQSDKIAAQYITNDADK